MIGDDPVAIMGRLRRLLGDLDRANIDLIRLQRGAEPDVKFAADPVKAIAVDMASALEHLLTRLENSTEYKVAKRPNQPP